MTLPSSSDSSNQIDESNAGEVPSGIGALHDANVENGSVEPRNQEMMIESLPARGKQFCRYMSGWVPLSTLPKKIMRDCSSYWI
ncbi:hypothetical protein B9Z55_004908 [Caenorhabditis nigoni]|uniref:Uncharacterized protein n=1 Tax=Caenorhabditis nigoni TaxID=1611254 RepID=A0A2G5UYM4_9PELO|nr:hypothetical protein B9Z55_004908 [Caenorhabditis nigoni]